MRNDIKYLEEHHQITESAIGMAKVKIISGDCDGALNALKECCKKLDVITKKYQPATALMRNI